MKYVDPFLLVIGKVKSFLPLDQIETQAELLKAAEQTTFPSNQKIPAIFYPKNREEVQKILRIANQYKTPIHAISNGYNWGLGSKLPPKGRQFVMMLSKMDRIIEYNEDLGFVTIEPGVSFLQLSEYLRDRNAKHFLSVTGGPPGSSVLGNTVERGDGTGIYGDRSNFSCDLEVILPTGELVETGFGSYEGMDNQAAALARDGLGPGVNGLFYQSNLGVVTRITIWLQRKPLHFQSYFLTLGNDDQLDELLRRVRDLMGRGVIPHNGFCIWNTDKFLSSNLQYHDIIEQYGSNLHLALPKYWHKSKWVGLILQYPQTKLIGKSLRKEVLRHISPVVPEIHCFHKSNTSWMKRFHRLISRYTGFDILPMLDLAFFKSPYFGYPTLFSSLSTYWRKRFRPDPNDMNPDRDLCGLHWLCHTLPLKGNHHKIVSDIVEDTCDKHGFEPNVSFFAMTERQTRVFIALIYDREDYREEQKAQDCYWEMGDRLVKAGYPHFRLGTQSYGITPWLPDRPGNIQLIQTLKKTLDPNDILSPGKYDFRSRWKD